MDALLTNGWNGFAQGWPGERLLEGLEGLLTPELSGEPVPAAEVIEDEDNFHFYFDMPGVKTDSLEVRIDEGVLVIEGERARPQHPGEATLHRSERRYGKLHRAFRLPAQFSNEPVTASYSDGVLHVTIAKPAAAKPVRIKVDHK